MDNQSVITDFVKQTLGCHCPDEVFRVIETSGLNIHQLPVYRIDVGKTLLVYLCPIWSDHIGTDADTGRKDSGNTNTENAIQGHERDIKGKRDEIKSTMNTLLSEGRNDRDQHGFNRFRLVMPSGLLPAFDEQLQDEFRKRIKDDEKLHLHLLDSTLLAWAEESCLEVNH